MTRALVLCDGVGAPTEADRLPWDYRHEVRQEGVRANLTLRLQEISDSLGATVADRAMDLVRIAAYVYWADQMVPRGGDTDFAGDHWRRAFLVCAPVSDADYWDAPGVQSALEDVLAFASEDSWAFSFRKMRFPQQLALEGDPSAPRYHPDCVALFSGGADSLCATVGAVAQGKRKPLLVSHRPAPNVDQQQRVLAEHLRIRLPGWQFPRASLWVNRLRSRERDNTQRTRSFLFASIGAAIASTLGLSEVLLPDNGVVSLNLPISAQLLGAKASRSSHPKFIALFNRLTAQVLPHAPRLSNPLWSRTKAECLETLKVAGVPELLQESRSCSRSRGLPGATPHCGVCLQCVERRFASLAAEMDEFDLAERYQTDIFCNELEGDARTTAESYMRFARQVNELPAEQLFFEYPQLTECILPDDPSSAETAEALSALLKRHAAQAFEVAEKQVATWKRELVTHKLPAGCLLSLLLAREPRREGASSPTVELTPEEEAACARHNFKNRQRIHITGHAKGRTTLVLVDEDEVRLADSHLRFLMRLVLGLLEAEDGFIPLERLESPGRPSAPELAFGEAPDQLISRTRARFLPALRDANPRQFIEVSRRRVRLSSHRRLVTWDGPQLERHPDPKIQKLVRRLQEQESSAPAPA